MFRETGGLCLSRRVGESIVLYLPDGSEVSLHVVRVSKHGTVRIRFIAPSTVRIVRSELGQWRDSKVDSVA